ncbi:MAG: Uncharacterised protein [Methanobacteriota archaeon]|nr:MAG: Uncharacterised protein [Euryarchaeota archaeon]
MLKFAEPLFDSRVKLSVALTIVELECIPTSSRLILIKPYWSLLEEEPTVNVSSPPMLEFLAALDESTNVSSIVSLYKPRLPTVISKEAVLSPLSVTSCPGRWNSPSTQEPN